MGSSETVAALRFARVRDETLKAHKQHCSAPRCEDCLTLKVAARNAWVAWKRLKMADALPAPGQVALFLSTCG